MSAKTSVNRSALLAAVAALCAVGLLASPAAHAESCTVNGDRFVLHQSNGFDTTVAANGSAIGPAVRVTEGADIGPGGSASGTIAGRTIQFDVVWDTNQAGLEGDPGTAHFTGTIGENVAHGTVTGKSYVIDGRNFWVSAPWDSVGFPFTCTVDQNPPADRKTLGDATVVADTDIYDKPDGKGQKIGTLLAGEVHPLMEPCRHDWCRVGQIELGGFPGLPNGTAWVYAKDYLTFSN
jgi:hypothetical protein